MKNIVLINSSLEGHNLAFVRIFTKILLELGHSVYCVVPDPEKIQNWIEQNGPSLSVNFKVFPYSIKPNKFRFIKKFDETIDKFTRWHQEAGLIKKIEKQKEVKINFVFYAWLDYQLASFMHSAILDMAFPYKWGGLYFHPYHLRQSEKFINRKANWRDYDSVFISRNCKVVAIHDRSIIDKFSKRIGKPVIHFPETADATEPDFSNKQYRNIRENAKGRLVIGMIGCEKHKGTLTMVRLAKEADPSRYYFAFIGVLPKDSYSQSEWNEVQDFIHEARENCYFHFESIPEGSAYNAVFSSFDIPFLIYNNFISSSNRLTKAAIFKKLVLASDNYCIGDDVRQYNLGMVVQPGNYRSALIALEELAEKINKKTYPVKEWDEYCWINSEEILRERFQEIIDLI